MTLAYLDSFAGLVPCRIVAVGDWGDKNSDARIQFTATRGAYKRGEFHTAKLWNVIPRNAIVRRKYSTRILPHNWKEMIAK